MVAQASYWILLDFSHKEIHKAIATINEIKIAIPTINHNNKPNCIPPPAAGRKVHSSSRPIIAVNPHPELTNVKYDAMKAFTKMYRTVDFFF